METSDKNRKTDSSAEEYALEREMSTKIRKRAIKRHIIEILLKFYCQLTGILQLNVS
jgi:hypothetical protein